MEKLQGIKKEVKELRFALGLTQKSFSKLIGVSESAVKQWESGRCYPSPPHMKVILGIKEMIAAGVAKEVSASPGETITDDLIKKVYDKYIKDKLN